MTRGMTGIPINQEYTMDGKPVHCSASFMYSVTAKGNVESPIHTPILEVRDKQRKPTWTWGEHAKVHLDSQRSNLHPGIQILTHFLLEGSNGGKKA